MDDRGSGKRDQPTEDEEERPVSSWEKLVALEEPKKPRKRSWLDDPNIGGDGPQTPG